MELGLWELIGRHVRVAPSGHLTHTALSVGITSYSFSSSSFTSFTSCSPLTISYDVDLLVVVWVPEELADARPAPGGHRRVGHPTRPASHHGLKYNNY